MNAFIAAYYLSWENTRFILHTVTEALLLCSHMHFKDNHVLCTYNIATMSLVFTKVLLFSAKAKHIL